MYGAQVNMNGLGGVAISGKAFGPSDGIEPTRAPIDGAMTSLGERIENLAMLISALEGRFSAVLRSVPPQTSNQARQDVNANSPIAGLLCDRIAKLYELQARLESILDRCEL